LLPKSTRKKLLEHNWVEMARKDSNPYQTLHRLRTKAIRAVDDLILIAQRLPYETQKEIFDYKNTKKLVLSILGENDSLSGNSDIHDSRRLQLAASLVEIGMKVCIEQYQTKIEQDSVLNDLTINHLARARDICNAISFKARLPQVEEEAEKEDLVYLFNWNRIQEIHEIKVDSVKGQDTKKFLQFLQDICLEEGTPFDVINTISFAADSYHSDLDFPGLLNFEFTDIYGNHGYGSILLNFEERAAYLNMKAWDVTIRRDLIVKTEDEDLQVYKKRRSASKLLTESIK
jgi:hypothetical protein